MGSQRKNAFTLVELLVVIAIIAVLVAILLPALSKARAQALQLVCESNLRQWGMGIQMYADQNKGCLPEKGPDGSDASANAIAPSGGVTLGIADSSWWLNAIPPLVNSKSYYQLLLDNASTMAGGGLETGTPTPNGNPSIYVCPAAADVGILPGSSDIFKNGYLYLHGSDQTNTWGLNGTIHQAEFPFNCTYVWNSKLTSANSLSSALTTLKMSSLQPSSEVVVMVEKIINAGEYKDRTVQNYYNSTYPNNPYNAVSGPKIVPAGLINTFAQSKACWTRFTARHRSGGNLLFGDGHVAWFAWTDIQINPNNFPNKNDWDANQPGKVIWSIEGAVGAPSGGD